ncbi:MAG: class I SAM-dependent methyltransferase [Deltaproteobacteria bacterium]|nr:class I SAM-dependent methyltransferase [Deltaproteobacteria bacterium]
MAKTAPFDKNPRGYDEWFDKNKFVYESELQAIRRLLPEEGLGIEIGLGTGRFAGPLGIKIGVEPSARMRDIARQRGIDAVEGVAEKLPFMPNWYNFAIMVTVICFLDDAGAAFKEAKRIIKPGGFLIVAFIDRNSPLGKSYEVRKNESEFYRDARFYSVDDVIGFFEAAGFKELTFVQTIFKDPKEISEVEPVKEGYGEGSFVVIRGKKEGLKDGEGRASGFFF